MTPGAEPNRSPFTTPVGERESYAAFTRPPLAANLVRGMQAGSGIEALVRERFPEARLLREASAEQALRAVADTRADLFIGDQHVVMHLVERGLLANLELRTSLGPGATPLGPAVRRDLPHLRAILDQAIASVRRGLPVAPGLALAAAGFEHGAPAARACRAERGGARMGGAPPAWATTPCSRPSRCAARWANSTAWARDISSPRPRTSATASWPCGATTS